MDRTTSSLLADAGRKGGLARAANLSAEDRSAIARQGGLARQAPAAPACADPLLAAIIAKLPAPGASFPPEERAAWLKMVTIAFDLAYGVDGGASAIEVPQFLADVVPRASLQLVRPRYRIDVDGFALGPDGPIAPEDVPPDQELFDERNPGDQGDLASVYWKGEGVRPAEKIPALKVRAA